MRNTRIFMVRNFSAPVVFALGVCACSGSDAGDTAGSSGGSAASTAGAPGVAGASGTTTTAGAPGAGAPGTGGKPTSGTAGAGASAGGPVGTAGAPAGAGGATGAGGGMSGASGGSLGMSGSAGMGGAPGTSGSPGGGTSTTECVKGQTKGKDVAVIGESFIAMSHGITKQIEKQAKAAGALPQGESYVDNSVSGTTLANNQIPSQYDKAVQSSGTIKYVVMDGGGNDCLINNNGDAALSAATALFKTMADKKTEKIMYFFYPDPIGGSFGSLKTCLDALRPKMKALCDGLTAPKCYWLDLRPTWNGHNEYTSDGIHPTDAGSVATGDVVWDAMKTNCIAQ
jgi:hypothetical protein